MKLVHPDWEKQIEWRGDTIPVLVIENPRYHFQLLETLHQQADGADGPFVLSDKGREYDLAKCVELVLSPWDMAYTGKKLTAAFWARIKGDAQEEIYGDKWREAVSALLRYADELSIHSVLPLIFDLEAEPVSLLKAIRLRLDPENETLAERILSYMDICTELLHTRCFVFSQIHSFLSRREREELYRNVLMKEYHMLLIEGHEYDMLEIEERFIIDADLCQIF